MEESELQNNIYVQEYVQNSDYCYTNENSESDYEYNNSEMSLSMDSDTVYETDDEALLEKSLLI